MKDWFEVKVTVLPDATEAVESALCTMGAAGTATDSLKKKDDEPLVVSGYFEEPVSLEDVEEAISNELRNHSLDRDDVREIEFEKVKDQDWLAEWKKHWKPTEVGQFIVAPPWAAVETTDKHVIRIEPNMAFGTGTHETTQLCLEALGRLVTPGMTVIDVGTGTGVLAIAAAMLGCKHIRAFDTDAASVNIAELNAEANGVIDSIFFYEGSIAEDTPPADLVVANLTLDVILPILPLLIEKADIWLVLSGILATQGSDIRNALGCCESSEVEITRRGEWISVVVGT
jgi:ribosomal protein L11 methyltransferase